MDTKIVLKSSTKVSLNDRFSKIQTRVNQQQPPQQQQQQGLSRRSLTSNNSLSIKRAPIGSKKLVTEARGLRSIGGTLRRGSVASRLMQKPFQNTVQDYVANPVRGGTVRGRGFQRGGGRGGVAARGGGQTNPREQGRVGNNPTRGFGKRTQPSGVKKEDLDKDIEKYMCKTKGFLDDQLDDYQRKK